MKNKIMSMLVVLTMILTSFMVMNTLDVGIVDTAKGTRDIDITASGVRYILTNDGTVNQSSNLTCGEWITWVFPRNDFTNGDDYIVKVWNGTDLVNLVVDDEEVDDYGNLYIKFRVPGWHELSTDPLTDYAKGKITITGGATGNYINVTIANASTDWSNVPWTTSNTITAGLLAANITDNITGYSATSSGAVVYITNTTEGIDDSVVVAGGNGSATATVVNMNGGDASTGHGTWNISLWKDESTDTAVSWATADITIGNLYDIWFEYDGEEVDHLIYGKAYSGFEVHARNWTGTDWDDSFCDSSHKLDAVLYHQNGSTVEESESDFTDAVTLQNFLINNTDISTTYKEVFWWMNVTWNDLPTRSSNVSIPVLLNMTYDISSDITWGETIEIDNGYLLDGAGDGIGSYPIRVYAPCNGSYVQAKSFSTAYDGTFSTDIHTGSDYEWSAGTWYIGTETSDASPRVNTTDAAPHVPGFIPYSSFEVATKESIRVNIENSDDLTTGFNQTINVSVKNESWMSSTNKEYKSMYIHVTGISAYNFTTGEYDDSDIVQVIDASYTPYVDSNEKYAYYEFSYHFNDTGTGTIIVSHSGNLTAVKNDTTGDTTRAGESSFYTLKYGNGNLDANMTGSTTFEVVSAESMNLVVSGSRIESVQVTEGPTPCSSNRWINDTGTFTFDIYGSSSSDRMNATIDVSGCGLDFTVDEDDPGNTDECTAYPGDGSSSDGHYSLTIAPKTAGTLTITATNGTSSESITKDYTITGLTGSVTTAVGDDKKITVGSPETITVTVSNGQYAEVTLTYFDTDWTKTDTATIVVNNTDGDNTEGEGLNGIFTFVPDEEDIDELGYIVVAAKAGGTNYMYDIIEIEPIYDLEIVMITPSLANATPSLTVGLEQDLVFNVHDSTGADVEDDDPIVTVKLIDEDNDEDHALMTWSSENSGTYAIAESGGEWQIEDMVPWWKGQIVIECINNSGGIAHAGNQTFDVDYATFTYAPTAATAGIGTENLTVSVSGIDANGDALPEGTRIYFWCNDSVDAAVCDSPSSGNAVDFKDADVSIDLDEDGMGEFELDKVGDNKTQINATFADNNPSLGNRTLGIFNIYFPTFELDPETIYIGQANMITVTAKDHEGSPIEGLNLTFVSSISSILSAQPDPVQTNADGIAQLSINPLASGKLNVTIARDLAYEGGQLNWTDAVVTDTYVTATSIQGMKISLSKSPIYEGETLTVTVTSGTNTLSGVAVEFGEETGNTDSNGQATFTVPDPGVESAVYTVTAEKEGYAGAEKSLTVIKIWDVVIIAPSSAPGAGEEFTITLLAKGAALAGATVEFNGNTYTSGADGKLTITAPDTAGDYTVTASYEDYTTATVTITIKEGGGVPGFELLTLIAALGVAFILLRRRR